MKLNLILMQLMLVAQIVAAEEINSTTHDAPVQEHHGYNHHVSLFLGGTTNFQHSETDFTVGGDYVFRLPVWKRLISIGVFGEVILAEHKEGLCGVLVFLHPVGGLKFFAAPGASVKEDASHFLFRVGAGYDFHLHALSITPALYTDIIEGHASLAYGINFGFVF